MLVLARSSIWKAFTAANLRSPEGHPLASATNLDWMRPARVATQCDFNPVCPQFQSLDYNFLGNQLHFLHTLVKPAPHGFGLRWRQVALGSGFCETKYESQGITNGFRPKIAEIRPVITVHRLWRCDFRCCLTDWSGLLPQSLKTKAGNGA